MNNTEDLKKELVLINTSYNSGISSEEMKQKITSLWPKFKQTYEQNTDNVINNYNAIIENNKILNLNQDTLLSNQNKLRELNDEISTKQRQSEISINNQRIITSKYNLVKVVLIIAIGLTALPIMRMFGIIDKKLNFTILSAIIVLLSLYVGYTIYIKDLNRDSSFFNEFNFLNPNVDQIQKKTETTKKQINGTKNVCH